NAHAMSVQGRVSAAAPDTGPAEAVERCDGQALPSQAGGQVKKQWPDRADGEAPAVQHTTTVTQLSGIRRGMTMAESSHDTVFFSNPIDVDAWNQAEWLGVGYLVDPNRVRPPVFGIVFRDETAGRKIFDGWRQMFGGKDAKEDLRIAVIEGYA